MSSSSASKAKKFRFKAVIDGLRGGSSTSSQARQDTEIEETLRRDHFHVTRTVRHGFPFQPTSLAFDPLQHLLAIGNRTGALRIIGQPGVDFHCSHDSEVSITQILFLTNEGGLVTVTSDDHLHLWNFVQKNPAIVHSLKFQREKISRCHLPFQSKWLYVGTERGNVHVVNIETFTCSGYIINWNKAIELSRKTHPGPVVQLSDNPCDSNKLLIGFESGTLVFWDLRTKTADFRYNSQEALRSVSWHNEGKQFMCSHSDGSLSTWNVKAPQRPCSVTYPHAKMGQDGKPDLCKPIPKVQWKSTRLGEPVVVFSGGMSYERSGRTPSITVMTGKSTTVLEMEHNVVDFVCLCETPWINDFQDPYAIVVLLQNDLVIIDLTTPGYPCFENPYPMDIHESPVTACQYYANCPNDIIPALVNTWKNQKKSGFSEKQWPINGGNWGASGTSYPEIIITGHADGSLKFWDASSVNLQFLYKLKTAKVFEKPKRPSEDKDDDPFAIQSIFMCLESRLLCVAGPTHCILFKFSKQETSIETCTLEFSIVYEVYDELDSPEFDFPKPSLSGMGQHSSSVGSYSSNASDNAKTESMTSVKAKAGTHRWSSGFSPELLCILCWVDGEPPGNITVMSLNSSYGLLAFGNDSGLAIVDYLQKTCLLNLGTPDLYGSMDPYQRAPRSPRSKKAPGESLVLGSEECKSPTVDQVSLSLIHHPWDASSVTKYAATTSHLPCSPPPPRPPPPTPCAVYNPPPPHEGISSRSSQQQQQQHLQDKMQQQNHPPLTKAKSQPPPLPPPPKIKAVESVHKSYGSVGKSKSLNYPDHHTPQQQQQQHLASSVLSPPEIALSTLLTSSSSSFSSSSSTATQIESKSSHRSHEKKSPSLISSILGGDNRSSSTESQASNNSKDTKSPERVGSPLSPFKEDHFEKEVPLSSTSSSSSLPHQSQQNNNNPVAPPRSKHKSRTRGLVHQPALDLPTSPNKEIGGDVGSTSPSNMPCDSNSSSSNSKVVVMDNASPHLHIPPIICLPRSCSESKDLNECNDPTTMFFHENPTLLSPGSPSKPKSVSTGDIPAAPSSDSTLETRKKAKAVRTQSDSRTLSTCGHAGFVDAAAESDRMGLKASSDPYLNYNDKTSCGEQEGANAVPTLVMTSSSVEHDDHDEEGEECTRKENWFMKKIHKKKEKKKKTSKEVVSETEKKEVEGGEEDLEDESKESIGHSLSDCDISKSKGRGGDLTILDPNEFETQDIGDFAYGGGTAGGASISSSGGGSGGNKNFLQRVSVKIKALGTRKSSNEDEEKEKELLSPNRLYHQRSQDHHHHNHRKIKIDVLDLTDDGAKKTSMRKMFLSDVLQSRRAIDKTDGSSFSRSRSSSMSSLENVTKEAIQSLVFTDSFTRKSDNETSPCLWVGTSLGSVIVTVLVLQQDQRLSQPVIVSPSGSLYRMKGSIICMSFLDFKGVLIPALSEQWREIRDNKDYTEKLSNKASRQMSVSNLKPKISPTSSTEINNDRQFAIICSEKQARAISLPSQTCAFKVKITETSFVVRAETVAMRDSVCLLCYVANGHILAFSLPSLKPLFDADFLPLTDYRVARTFCFSNSGHAMFLCSPTEVQKITYSAEIAENLSEMVGELFLARETPEAPKAGFLKTLFGGGVSQLDREELFGEASGKASKGLAKHIPGSAGLQQLQHQSAASSNEFARTRLLLNERGEKLGEVQDRTEQMMISAENFSSAAHQLLGKWKDKKWYQF